MKFKFTTGSLLILILFSKPLSGQIDYDKVPEVTSKIFINDVYVQKNPEVNLGLSDILIEDGLIKNISSQMTPPFDARIIEADSAYAYSGFIDALSHVGIPKKEQRGKRPEVKFTGFPPNNVAGITPEVVASSLVETQESSLKSHRDLGFAIVHSVPRGRMLPGQGSVISTQGHTTNDLIIRDSNSLFLQFSGARGYYPNTVIGVMAKWRDMYRKAFYHSKNLDQYKLSPKGMKRPEDNKTINALIPVTKRTMPVYMKTNKVKDIYRALELKKELGYKLVLSDVQQLGSAIDEINSLDVSILLSLKLPKKEKKKEKSDSLTISEENKALKERKEKSYLDYVSQASKLEKANKKFGISMLSSKGKEFKSNMMTLIENGLSEKAALASLTTNPAKILGIDNIAGTLEAGKLANIILSSQPYFEKDSKIKYVIVDGHINEIKQKKKKKGNGNIDEDSLSKLLGEWTYSVIVFEQEQSGILTISNSSGELKVELVDDSTPDDTDIGSDVSFEDDTLSFSVTVDGGGQPMPVTITLDIDNNNFTGSAVIENVGSFEMEGSKNSSPE